MIVDITNEILTSIKTLLPTVTVHTSFDDSVTTFPCVTVEESSNSTYTESVDTSGEKHNRVSFDINVFDDSTKKMSVVKGLRNQIDTLMTTTYGMTRVSSLAVPNYLDSRIYRWTLRYEVIIDANKKIYRG